MCTPKLMISLIMQMASTDKEALSALFTKTNQLLNEREEARDRVVSLEEQVQVLEVAKSECLDSIAAAKAEVNNSRR